MMLLGKLFRFTKARPARHEGEIWKQPSGRMVIKRGGKIRTYVDPKAKKPRNGGYKKGIISSSKKSAWFEHMRPSDDEWRKIGEQRDPNALAKYIQQRFWTKNSDGETMANRFVRGAPQRRTKEYEEAEDIVQETAMRLIMLQQQNRFDMVTQNTFPGYVTGVMINIGKEEIRRNEKGDPFSESLDEVYREIKDVGEQTEKKFLVREAAKGFMSVARKIGEEIRGRNPERDREIWSRHINGMPPKQILREMKSRYPQMTVGTVSSVNKRLRAKVNKQLEDQKDQDDIILRAPRARGIGQLALVKARVKGKVRWVLKAKKRAPGETWVRPSGTRVKKLENGRIVPVATGGDMQSRLESMVIGTADVDGSRSMQTLRDRGQLLGVYRDMISAESITMTEVEGRGRTEKALAINDKIYTGHMRQTALYLIKRMAKAGMISSGGDSREGVLKINDAGKQSLETASEKERARMPRMEYANTGSWGGDAPGASKQPLEVLDDVPNMSSISATLDNYTILPGIRQVDMNELFDPDLKSEYEVIRSFFYSPGDFDRVKELKGQIEVSRQIKPLIIVRDAEGSYVLEGAHRAPALKLMGEKSVPAVVVIDEDNPPPNRDAESSEKSASEFSSAIESKYPGVKMILMESKNGHIELANITVPKSERGSGTGSKVMQELTDYADARGSLLKLTPDTSYGGSSVARLTKFYKRFGFVENKGRNKDYEISNSMYRLPEIQKAKRRQIGESWTRQSGIRVKKVGKGKIVIVPGGIKKGTQSADNEEKKRFGLSENAYKLAELHSTGVSLSEAGRQIGVPKLDDILKLASEKGFREVVEKLQNPERTRAVPAELPKQDPSTLEEYFQTRPVVLFQDGEILFNGEKVTEAGLESRLAREGKFSKVAMLSDGQLGDRVPAGYKVDKWTDEGGDSYAILSREGVKIPSTVKESEKAIEEMGVKIVTLYGLSDRDAVNVAIALDSELSRHKIAINSVVAVEDADRPAAIAYVGHDGQPGEARTTDLSINITGAERAKLKHSPIGNLKERNAELGKLWQESFKRFGEIHKKTPEDKEALKAEDEAQEVIMAEMKQIQSAIKLKERDESGGSAGRKWSASAYADNHDTALQTVVTHEIGHALHFRSNKDFDDRVRRAFDRAEADRALFPSEYSMKDRMEYVAECYALTRIGRGDEIRDPDMKSLIQEMVTRHEH